jgi:membrane protein implicated in regulation of membrane protease activity
MAKKRKTWSTRVLVKYLLIQLPSWILWALGLTLLRHWIAFPGWVVPAFVAAWVGKDIFMFRFVWRAYDSEAGQVAHPRPGDQAVVVQKLSPAGYVSFDGELWRARLAGEKQTAAKGQAVWVRDVQGLTLIVEPVAKIPRASPGLEGASTDGVKPGGSAGVDTFLEKMGRLPFTSWDGGGGKASARGKRGLEGEAAKSRK